jgi:hypothetical protein
MPFRFPFAVLAGSARIPPSVVSERSSAWLERQLWELDVAGSNPVAPTIRPPRRLSGSDGVTWGRFGHIGSGRKGVDDELQEPERLREACRGYQ